MIASATTAKTKNAKMSVRFFMVVQRKYDYKCSIEMLDKFLTKGENLRK
jgi:hypothetical protein